MELLRNMTNVATGIGILGGIGVIIVIVALCFCCFCILDRFCASHIRSLETCDRSTEVAAAQLVVKPQKLLKVLLVLNVHDYKELGRD